MVYNAKFKRNNLSSQRIRWKPNRGEGQGRAADELEARMKLLQPREQHVETVNTKIPIFSQHPVKNGNHCQINACFSPLHLISQCCLEINNTRLIRNVGLDQNNFVQGIGRGLTFSVMFRGPKMVQQCDAKVTKEMELSQQLCLGLKLFFYPTLNNTITKSHQSSNHSAHIWVLWQGREFKHLTVTIRTYKPVALVRWQSTICN